MKFILFGGTGLIGNALSNTHELKRHELIIVSRKTTGQPPGNNQRLIGYDRNKLQTLFEGEYAIINLAGAGIGDRLWTRKRKAELLNSRISVTTLIRDLINAAEVKPELVIQASAVGYYGSRENEILVEKSEKGTGFLADLTHQWEQALFFDQPLKTRIVYLRTGLVLDKRGGFMSKLILPFKLFLGGYFGNGNQWMPWIHIQDEIGAILFIIKNKSAAGAINLVAPNPERMKEFCRKLGKVMKRNSWLFIPSFIIKLIPGGFGKELLLVSQRVKPEKLKNLGYVFQFESIDKAFSNLYGHE